MIENNISKTLRRTIVTGSSLAVLMTAFCVSLTGCSHHDSSDNSGSNAPSNGMVSSDNFKSSDIAATVNGDPITIAEYYSGLQHYVPATLPNYPNNPQLDQQAGMVVLQTLITNHLKLQLASKLGVPVQQSDIDNSFADYCLEIQAQSVQSIDAVLSQQGFTEDQFKQEVLAPQVAEVNVLQKTVVITPEALQDAYKANIAKYTVPSGVHIHRIVCATENQAQSVAQGLKSGQPIANFLPDNLARDGVGGDYTDDSDIANWIRTDHIDPALGSYGSQLISAKAGDVIGPVQIGANWWVIQVAETRPTKVLTFDQVHDVVRISYIRQVATQNQGAADLQGAVIKSMQSAAISINLPAYQNLAAQMHDISIAQAPVNPNPGAQQAHP